MEAGIFLVIVALPLVFAPFSAMTFVDAKLVVLLGSGLLVAMAAPSVDRRTALASVVWVVSVGVAGVFGVDPWWSLLGSEDRGIGLLSLGTSGLLLTAGTALTESLRSRAQDWLMWTGVVVSAVAVIGRFVPIGGDSWELGALSSTLGHRVFVGGFVAAAVVAATAIRPRPITYGAVLVLGSGLAVSAARSAWIGAILGIAVALTLDRARWRTTLALLLPLVVAIAAWTLVDRVIADKEIEFSAAPRFAQLDEGSAQDRLPSIRANLRAWSDNALIGTGSGTGWLGYLSHISADEMRSAGRGFADAHNLIVESGTTTGVVGTIALVGIGWCVVAGAWRAPAGRRWALGAAVALGVVHTLQPLNLVLTPLMFLMAGMSLGRSNRTLTVRRWVIAFAIIGLAASSLRFVASTFDRYGSTYASDSAFRWAMKLQPLRLRSTLALAEHRGLDHRMGDSAAAGEAHRLLERAVGTHGWNPRVRLFAANVELLLDDPTSGRRWVDEHLEIFPNDPVALAGAAAFALRAGDRAEAASLARSALSLDPRLEQARLVLRSARGD